MPTTETAASTTAEFGSASQLTPEQVEAFGAELEAIRQRHLDDRGDQAQRTNLCYAG